MFIKRLNRRQWACSALAMALVPYFSQSLMKMKPEDMALEYIRRRISWTVKFGSKIPSCKNIFSMWFQEQFRLLATRLHTTQYGLTISLFWLVPDRVEIWRFYGVCFHRFTCGNNNHRGPWKRFGYLRPFIRMYTCIWRALNSPLPQFGCVFKIHCEDDSANSNNFSLYKSVGGQMMHSCRYSHLVHISECWRL